MQRLAIYAVETFLPGAYDVRYVMTEVDPPARTYQLSVPPGQYQVVARLDSDPLSAAGYLQCYSYSCSPVMTRAGELECQSLACQPALTSFYVGPGQAVSHIDVGGWGSPYALDRLWTVDEFGAPGPLTYQPVTPGTTPSASPPPPSRPLPAPSTADLPAAFDVTSLYHPTTALATVHLPEGWSAVADPAQAVREWARRDFSDRPARTPLALAGDAAWLTVETTDSGPCAWTHPAALTAQVQLGPARLYFENPHSPVGVQPFSGYSVVALKPGRSCIVLRFTSPTEQTREASLPTFLAIIQATT